jgi:hypothetical protein
MGAGVGAVAQPAMASKVANTVICREKEWIFIR